MSGGVVISRPSASGSWQQLLKETRAALARAQGEGCEQVILQPEETHD
jgi:hypothetical protein